MFGSHLNKKKVSKKTFSGGKESNKGPTCKLRKWTKDSGYKTVIGGESLNGGCSQNGGIEDDGSGVKGGNVSSKGDVSTHSTVAAGNEVQCT